MLRFGLGRRTSRMTSVPGWILSGASTDLDFADSIYYDGSGGTLSSMISTTRASTGYAQTAGGILIPFASNVPRITDQGLLVEEARTNLFTYSQPLIANLASSGGTIANGSAPATNPLPAATQWLTMGGAGVLSFAYSPATLSVTTQYTISFLVKMADNSVPRVSVGDVPTNFDMALNIANNPAGISNITVTALAGNVYRVTGTATTGGSVTQNHGILQYADQSGKSFSVSQFQIEEGAFATSPILTSAGTATRAADVITLTGAAATAALAAKAAYFETNLLANGTAPRFAEYAGGAILRIISTTTVDINNGSAGATATLGSGTTAGLVKTAFGMDASSITSKANGGTQATNAVAWAGNTGAVILGNNSGAARAINGYLRRATFGNAKGQFDSYAT